MADEIVEVTIRASYSRRVWEGLEEECAVNTDGKVTAEGVVANAVADALIRGDDPHNVQAFVTYRGRRLGVPHI